MVPLGIGHLPPAAEDLAGVQVPGHGEAAAVVDVQHNRRVQRPGQPPFLHQVHAAPLHLPQGGQHHVAGEIQGLVPLGGQLPGMGEGLPPTHLFHVLPGGEEAGLIAQHVGIVQILQVDQPPQQGDAGAVARSAGIALIGGDGFHVIGLPAEAVVDGSIAEIQQAVLLACAPQIGIPQVGVGKGLGRFRPQHEHIVLPGEIMAVVQGAQGGGGVLQVVRHQLKIVIEAAALEADILDGGALLGGVGADVAAVLLPVVIADEMGAQLVHDQLVHLLRHLVLPPVHALFIGAGHIAPDVKQVGAPPLHLLQERIQVAGIQHIAKHPQHTPQLQPVDVHVQGFPDLDQAAVLCLGQPAQGHEADGVAQVRPGGHLDGPPAIGGMQFRVVQVGIDALHGPSFQLAYPPANLRCRQSVCGHFGG